MSLIRFPKFLSKSRLAILNFAIPRPAKKKKGKKGKKAKAAN